MKEQFDIILNDYLKDDSVKTDRTKIHHKALLRELSNKIEYLLQDDNFIVKGSYAQATKAQCPWLCIFHKNITTSAKKGIYICYLFRSDMSGFYLTLNQGITFFEEQYGKDKYDAVSKTVEYFRKEIYSNTFQSETIDLSAHNSHLAHGYEHTTIKSKFYPVNQYTEEELITDLKHMISLYQNLYQRIKYISYEELIQLIICGNREMLENTSTEFLLKLHHEIYLLDDIAKLYKVERKELDKIRKKKGIGDIIFENSLRDTITIVNHFDEICPDIDDQLRQSMIIGVIDGYVMSHGHRDFYKDKFLAFNWSKRNIKKVIIEKGIDLSYRDTNLKGLYEKMDYILNDYLLKKAIEQEMMESRQIVPNIHHRPARKRSAIQTKYFAYPRNSRVRKRALLKSGYCCEINPEHPTFFKRSDLHRYMETHHLIPLEFQEQFQYSLDVEANIISLCSNCHNEIHYGIENRRLIKQLYEKRKEDLRKCGIILDSVEQLYVYYDRYASELEERVMITE